MAPPKLSVDDLAKLAAAGVKMELRDLMINYVKEPRDDAPMFGQRLVRPLIDRWMLHTCLPNDMMMNDGREFPFHVSVWAEEAEENVYVFVAGYGLDPCIIEDPRHSYPSDALLVKLRILDKQRKPAQQSQAGVGQMNGNNAAQGPSQGFAAAAARVATIAPKTTRLQQLKDVAAAIRNGGE